MATYNSRSKESRNALAWELRIMLKAANFERLPSRRKGEEEIYFRDEGRFRVKVFTSIRTEGVGKGHARPKGKDSIKVCATRMLANGQEIGWISTTRVNRVGEISSIMQRTLKSMRGVWKEGLQRCVRDGIRHD